MVDLLGMGLTGIGLLGSLFGKDEEASDEQKQIYKLLMERAGGLDPKLLELMRARLRSSVGNEFAGLSASTGSRLRRQNVPVAKQEEIMDKLRSRRMGATSDALLDVERINEQVKTSALSNLSSLGRSFPNQQGFGGGFAQLFGAGLQQLLGNNYGSNFKFLDELDQAKRWGQQRAGEQLQFEPYRPQLKQNRAMNKLYP